MKRPFLAFAASLSFVAALLCILIVPKFAEMYRGLALTLPKATQTVAETSGWIPGGLFLFLASGLILLIIFDKRSIARVAAIATVILVAATAVVLPVMIILPLVVTISTAEDQSNNKKQNKSEHATPSNPSD